jgi:predicted dehydrogenase
LRTEAAGSYEQLLTDDGVDIVSIATFDDGHAGLVAEALRARKHVFVEKPLCRSSDEARAIKNVWVASGRRRLASNLVLRAAPLYEWLRQRIAEGDLGEIYAFDGDYLYGRIHKLTDGWRKDVPDYSVIQGGGIHLIDLMLWLTGQRPTVVSATGNRVSTAGTAFRYDDFAAATFGFESGLIGRITANFGCVHPHQHVVRVFGTKATFIYDDKGARLQRSRDEGSDAQPIDKPALPATKGDLIPSFVNSILDAADSGGAQHEFDVISACLAADQALASTRQERVEYL